MFYPVEPASLPGLHHIFKGLKEPSFFQKIAGEDLFDIFPYHIVVPDPPCLPIRPVDGFYVQLFIQHQEGGGDAGNDLFAVLLEVCDFRPCLLTFRNIPDRGDKADNGAFLIH